MAERSEVYLLNFLLHNITVLGHVSHSTLCTLGVAHLPSAPKKYSPKEFC